MNLLPAVSSIHGIVFRRISQVATFVIGFYFMVEKSVNTKSMPTVRQSTVTCIPPRRYRQFLRK
ncbi:MAG: hypothetical protein P8J37_19480 [Fuerstiella sp.]|nr:hypothetical protein [Fuerstiella sp.]